MSRLVLDAGVILKWYLETADESDLPQARAILEAWMEDRISILLPPHALVEVASVLARERSQEADALFAKLNALFTSRDNTPDDHIWQLAIRMAIKLNHHLFDTLYHAVALASDAILVTANERYYAKASTLGHVMLLRDLQL